MAARAGETPEDLRDGALELGAVGIDNRSPLDAGRVFVNQSVSFDSSPGTNASWRAVPDGVRWRLQTLRAVNGEDGPRPMQFVLADRDGTAHAVLSLSAANPVEVAGGGVLAWTGSVEVPAGWRVYATWQAMAGGARCNWQYTAVEESLP